MLLAALESLWLTFASLQPGDDDIAFLALLAGMALAGGVQRLHRRWSARRAGTAPDGGHPYAG
jgi:hypothetical protein